MVKPLTLPFLLLKELWACCIMLASFLGADFSSFIQVVVWCFLPLYGSFLGLTIPFLSKMPSTATSKKWASDTSTGAVYHTQLLFFLGTLLVLTCYRGHAGPLCQGQLNLTQPGAKFFFLILYFLGAAMGVSTAVGASTLKTTPLGFSVWYLGPTMVILWALLPLSTQLTTSLLVLELIGVALVWGLSSITSSSNLSVQRASLSAPSLIYALVIFVWASGISALSLLTGLGLTTLEGGAINFIGTKGLTSTERPFIGVSEFILALVLLLKFLMGGGQFLLMAWYRFLPSTGLVFYLFFYYPAHLLVGTTFFVGFFLSSLAACLVVMMVILIISAFALLPHLGAQTSPALTLAGSSFIGLSFLAIALLNVVS